MLNFLRNIVWKLKWQKNTSATMLTVNVFPLLVPPLGASVGSPLTLSTLLSMISDICIEEGQEK